MKILFVIPELSVGGTERQVTVLARALGSAGCAVRVLVLHPPRRPLPGAEGLDVRTFDAPRAHDPRVTVRLLREIRAFRPDVLHTFLFGFDLWANVAARLAHVPCVVSSRREVPRSGPSRHVRWQSAGNRLADAVIANSTAAAAAALRYERFLRPERVLVLPNAYEPRRAAASGLLPARGRPAVVNVANFWPGKGQDQLIPAFGDLLAAAPDASLWLVGEGPEQAACRRLAAQSAADRVHFLGERHDVDAILPRCDLFVSASSAESSPNAILEAMAAGVPVVARSVGGVSELLEEGRLGLLVAPDSADGLTRALVHAHRNGAEMAAMAARARAAVVEKHAPAVIAARCLELYRRATR